MSAQYDPKDAKGQPQPATNDPEEVIETPDEVQESNDEKIDQDFPGYPHYPAKDDILNPGEDKERVDIDVENLTRSHTISPDHLKSITGAPVTETDSTMAIDRDDEGDLGIVPGTDADVTAEDLMLLGDRNEDMDMGEDEELKARGWQPNSGKDLDVPDAELEADDLVAQEDEDNSYYSLGGDEMQNLRESDDQNNF